MHAYCQSGQGNIYLLFPVYSPYVVSLLSVCFLVACFSTAIHFDTCLLMKGSIDSKVEPN